MHVPTTISNTAPSKSVHLRRKFQDTRSEAGMGEPSNLWSSKVHKSWHSFPTSVPGVGHWWEEILVASGPHLCAAPTQTASPSGILPGRSEYSPVAWGLYCALYNLCLLQLPATMYPHFTNEEPGVRGSSVSTPRPQRAEKPGQAPENFSPFSLLPFLFSLPSSFHLLFLLFNKLCAYFKCKRVTWRETKSTSFLNGKF